MMKVESISSRHTYGSVRILQWALPLFLFAFATCYEVFEHLIAKEEPFSSFSMSAEILFFGILGPTAVFITLAYIRRLLEKQLAIQAELEELNRGLEAKVAERTRDLETKNAELRQLDQMKDEFVSLVSHGLRAPLTTINGGLELIMQDAASLPPTVRERMALLAQESACLTTLVQSILDLSRLEGGRFRLNLGAVALEPLLHRAAQAVAANREVHFEFAQVLPPAWADEVYVEQVVQNLIRNAVKYAPPHQPIHVSAAVSDGKLTIAVTDHGPGIPREVQDRVFERFHRGADSDRTPGWGLGLYFARKLVEAHGTTITVESPIWPDDAQHPGTRFTFMLPLAGEEEEESGIFEAGAVSLMPVAPTGNGAALSEDIVPALVASRGN